MAMDHITRQRDGAVLRIGFDRPERRNAISAAMYAALADAFAEAAADPSIKVVLLHGRPEVFTAGNDLSDFLENPPSGQDTPVYRFLSTLSSFPKPLLAAVTGHAIGIGTTMLMHCELVFAAEDARFSLPFVNLGICPEAGSSVLLPALAGYARAAELLLFGEPFDAQQAAAAGIVNRVLPAGEVLDFAAARARELAQRPLASLLETKRLMRAPLAAQLARAIEDESATFMRLLREPAAREAMAAFMQKRAPRAGS
jgi:enoyl-CoA hydratase/carnithine racemase